MIKILLLTVLLFIAPAVGGNDNCCTAYNHYDNYGNPTGFFYIKNHWNNRWVNCWLGSYNTQFQIPPNGASRLYRPTQWGCG